MNSAIRIRFWLPALLWLVVIALESLFLSSNVTGGWLWQIVRGLHISISWNTFERLHHLLRKAGHVTGYGILCVLVFRAWYRSKTESKPAKASFRPNSGERPRRIRGAALALAITLITAILDELHQSFDPTRTASARDVGLDFIGGVIFLAIALFVFKRWPAAPLREPEAVSA